MAEELVHLEVERGVATITLDSPENRNALSRQLVTELEARLDTALADDRARIIVLTATGSVFCSGADLKEGRAANEAGESRGPAGLDGVLLRMWHSPKPVIGRINGAARAGGLGLVAACDLSVAVETATFAVSEVRVGVIPAIISVILVPRLGIAKSLELFLTGEPFGAGDAVAMGLVTAAAPTGGLDDAVAGYVASIRKGAPGALAGAKRLVRDVPGLVVEEGMRMMAERSAVFFASDEAREGMTAFAEKRPPAWAAE